MKPTAAIYVLAMLSLITLCSCSGRDPMADMRRKLDELATEYPQINEAVQTQKRLQSQDNGWKDLDACNDVIEAFEEGDNGQYAWDFEALHSPDAFLESDAEEVASVGLRETAQIADHMIAASKHSHIVPDRNTDSGNVMVVEVVSQIPPVKWAAARVMAHQLLGNSARAQEELRVLMKVVERVSNPPTLVGVLVTFALRRVALDALLEHAGKPGWSRSAVEDILGEIEPYRPRYAQIFAAELAGLRELFGQTENEDTTLPAMAPTPDAVSNLEKEFDALAAGYGAVIRADAEKKLRLTRDSDLRRVIELLQPLREFPEEDALMMPAVEHVVLKIVTHVTEERMRLAAIELRLLEAENGPLASQRKGVTTILNDVPGVTVDYRRDEVALVADRNHWWYSDAGMPEPEELSMKPRS